MPLVKKSSRLSRVSTNIKNRLSRGNSPTGTSNHGSSDPAVNVPSQSSASQSSQFSNERIFCIKNERIIFKTLIDVNISYSEDSNFNNRVFFISLALDIFNFLLTTMQKVQLLENENEYVQFIEPFIDINSVFTRTYLQQQSDEHSLHVHKILFESYKCYYRLI